MTTPKESQRTTPRKSTRKSPAKGGTPAKGEAAVRDAEAAKAEQDAEANGDYRTVDVPSTTDVLKGLAADIRAAHGVMDNSIVVTSIVPKSIQQLTELAKGDSHAMGLGLAGYNYGLVACANIISGLHQQIAHYASEQGRECYLEVLASMPKAMQPTPAQESEPTNS